MLTNQALQGSAPSSYAATVGVPRGMLGDSVFEL